MVANNEGRKGKFGPAHSLELELVSLIKIRLSEFISGLIEEIKDDNNS
jgi:hypothetical protein